MSVATDALLAACRTGSLDDVDRALDDGADVNARNAAGDVPLLVAAAGGHVDVVRRLLEAGAAVEARGESLGETALMVAAGTGHAELVELLLAAGASALAEDGKDLFTAGSHAREGADSYEALVRSGHVSGPADLSGFAATIRLLEQAEAAEREAAAAAAAEASRIARERPVAAVRPAETGGCVVHWFGDAGSARHASAAAGSWQPPATQTPLWTVLEDNALHRLAPCALVDDALILPCSVSKSRYLVAVALENHGELWRTELDADYMMVGVHEGRLVFPPALVDPATGAVAGEVRFPPSLTVFRSITHAGRWFTARTVEEREDAELVCVDLATGADLDTGIRWPRRRWFPTMAAGEGVLVYGAADLTLRAAGLEDFAERWQVSVPKSVLMGAARQLMIDGARVYAVLDSVVWCIDIASGEVLWRSAPVAPEPTDTKDILNRGAVGGGRVFLSGGQDGHGKLACFDAVTGELLWCYACEHPRGYVHRVAVCGEYVYGETDGKSTAWRAADGSIAWQAEVFAGGSVVMIGDGKLVYLAPTAGGGGICFQLQPS